MTCTTVRKYSLNQQHKICFHSERLVQRKLIQPQPYNFKRLPFDRDKKCLILGIAIFFLDKL